MVRVTNTEIKASCHRVVQPGDCATQWGNAGLEVLSTPAILGNMERLCAEALTGYLESDEMTVGVAATLNHRAPTPLGATVEYRVRTAGVDRKIGFEFEVRDAHGTVVCDGTHLRAVIDATGFRRKVAELAAHEPAKVVSP